MLELLKKPLNAEHIDFKVAQLIKGKDTVWATILAYKDARVDMAILDDAVGPENWQNKYDRDSKGVLQCGIGIRCNVSPEGSTPEYEWIWKWSNGTPSDFEGEKGEYSDAFKRAGFMWGIGRALYDFPAIWVQLNEGDYYPSGDKVKATSKLRPNDWKWTVSDDYQSVTAQRKYGSEWKEIYNSNPYNKK
jgi:hypothetical protein